MTNLALSGFANSFNNPVAVNDPSQSGYVALSLSGGNWAVRQRAADTAGTSSTLRTSTAVTFDTWHEYEIVIWNDNKVSLMIDRARLFDRAALPLSSSWAFSNNRPYMVIGVIDFQGTPPFTVYYDDNTLTTVSAWSCDGWGSASCPFTVLGLPAAPSGLTVR